MEIKCVFMNIRGGMHVFQGEKTKPRRSPCERRRHPNNLTTDLPPRPGPEPPHAPRHGDPAVPFPPLHFERGGVITHNFLFKGIVQLGK